MKKLLLAIVLAFALTWVVASAEATITTVARVEQVPFIATVAEVADVAFPTQSLVVGIIRMDIQGDAVFLDKADTGVFITDKLALKMDVGILCILPDTTLKKVEGEDTRAYQAIFQTIRGSTEYIFQVTTVEFMAMGFGVQYETPTLTAAGYEPVADKYSMITTALIDVDDGVSPPILSAIAVQEITNDTGVKTMTDFKQTDAFQDAFAMTPETWIPYYKSEDGSGRASPILSARVVQEITGVIMMECPEQITAQSEPPTSVSVLRTEASTMEQGGVVICRLAGDVVGFDGISTTATLAVKFDEEVQKSVTQAFLGLYS